MSQAAQAFKTYARNDRHRIVPIERTGMACRRTDDEQNIFFNRLIESGQPVDVFSEDGVWIKISEDVAIRVRVSKHVFKLFDHVLKEGIKGVRKAFETRWLSKFIGKG